VLPSPVRILGDVLTGSTAILAHYPSNKTRLHLGEIITRWKGCLMSKLEQLTMTQLKSKLVELAHTTKTSMAPLLYYLRQKVKAQGKAGRGFGQWVEENLPITRRTADRWANEWAVSKGLKKPSKSDPRTFRQMSKSEPNKFVASLTMSLSKERHALFVEALKTLGNNAAEQVIYDAVIIAAEAAKKKPAQSVKGSE
jgi:hypothetical protein